MLPLALTTLLASLPPQDPPWSETATHPFTPPPDPLDERALLDLRHLNEPVAGQHGFVTTDGRGGCRDGSGRPLRFWAVNTFVGREPWTKKPLGSAQEPDLDRHLRFLAKRGVNLIRLHAQLGPDASDPAAKLDEVRTRERDWLWRTVATAKQHGIYTVISPYWATTFRLRAEWGVTGGERDHAMPLLFFEPRLQAAYRSWWRQLLSEPNPYTGVPLAKEPALALLQLQNEDSLLFWTFNTLSGAPRQLLQQRFAAWLVDKHGSLAKARQAWGKHRLDGDRDDLPELANVWELTQTRQGGFAARLADQTRFLGELQRDFYRDTVRYLRQELGCQQLVNASNWKAADAARLGDLERWTYGAGEVDAVNRYADVVHQGPNAGWAVLTGDRYAARSVLHDPRGLPLFVRQVEHRPMLVTECCWPAPHGYSAEGPFLAAAYQSLCGVDAVCWFACSDEQWTEPRSANGYLASLPKWTIQTPEVLGGFPAAASVFRRGLLQEAEPVLLEAKADQDLWERRTARLPEEASFDPNRDAGDPPPRLPKLGPVDPLTWLRGPVVVRFGAEASHTRQRDGRAAGSAGSAVRSATGEIVFDPRGPFCVVDAPAAQGVVGCFTKQPEHRLGDVRLVCRNHFAAVWVVALDDLPLATSRRVLVQCTTTARPTGFREAPVGFDAGGRKVDGFTILAHGTAPWRLRDNQLEVVVRNPLLRRAQALDANLQPAAEVALERADGAAQLRFPLEHLYVLLQAENP
jgi:hypothetical protein